jgi:multimeric flavodoxin WrbA
MEGIFQMNILAINGSPRKQGNTSIIIREMLEGATSAGAETTEVRLHDIDLKGCMGCLSCRTDHGKCKQKDDLSPYLEAMKTCDGLIVGSPIYMYHITGQTKIFVDRAYSLYPPDENGGYGTAIPPGKTYALVTSQGHPDPEQYKRPIRWLAGMTGSGFGFTEVGRIIHANSHLDPAKDSQGILEEARRIGRELVTQRS